MKKLIILLIIAVLSSLGFFGLTNPEELPVGLLMVPIILVFIILASGSLVLMEALSLLKGQDMRRKTLAILFGFMGSFFLSFQSTGGVVLGDVLLLVFILAITYIYILKY